MTYLQKNNQKKNADSPLIKKVISKEAVIVQTEIVEKSVYLKKETPATRYLKINPLYRQPNPGVKPGKYIPELKLCGLWLAQAGFDINSYVSVTVMNGLLVIRAAAVEEGHD